MHDINRAIFFKGALRCKYDVVSNEIWKRKTGAQTTTNTYFPQLCGMQSGDIEEKACEAQIPSHKEEPVVNDRLFVRALSWSKVKQTMSHHATTYHIDNLMNIYACLKSQIPKLHNRSWKKNVLIAVWMLCSTDRGYLSARMSVGCGSMIQHVI